MNTARVLVLQSKRETLIADYARRVKRHKARRAIQKLATIYTNLLLKAEMRKS
jgi:hypothetical protein